MKPPTGTPPNLVVTNGKGRLFLQSVLPRDAQVKCVTGLDLYTYGGKSYPPEREQGAAPECRVEISPPMPATEDEFLHVLTATESTTAAVPQAVAQVTDTAVTLTIGTAKIAFMKAKSVKEIGPVTVVLD
jgi:hypothetical protein